MPFVWGGFSSLPGLTSTVTALSAMDWQFVPSQTHTLNPSGRELGLGGGLLGGHGVLKVRPQEWGQGPPEGYPSELSSFCYVRTQTDPGSQRPLNVPTPRS